MATTNEDNNTLYFIVGGLVVLALIFGFIYIGNGNISSPGPVTSTTERTTETKIVPVPLPQKTENNTTNNYEAPAAPEPANPPPQ